MSFATERNGRAPPGEGCPGGAWAGRCIIISTNDGSKSQKRASRGLEVAGSMVTESVDERDRKKKNFLKAYSLVGTITKASKLTGEVGRGAVRGWLRDDDAFRRKFEKAREQYCDLLEDELHRRLLTDDHSPSQGSDVLLMFALKHMRPNTWGDNVSVEEDRARELILAIREVNKEKTRLKELNGSVIVEGEARSVGSEVE